MLLITLRLYSRAAAAEATAIAGAGTDAVRPVLLLPRLSTQRLEYCAAAAAKLPAAAAAGAHQDAVWPVPPLTHACQPRCCTYVPLPPAQVQMLCGE